MSIHAPHTVPVPASTQGTVMTPDLRTAIEPEDVLRLLRAIGFTHRDFSRLARVSERSVRRWFSDEAVSAGAASALNDLRNVVCEMRETGRFTDRGIVLWMGYDNAALCDASPLLVLSLGGTTAYVRQALQFLIDPDAPPVELPETVREALRHASDTRLRGLAAV